MNVKEQLNELTRDFGVSRLKAELLLAGLLGCGRLELPVFSETSLTAEQRETLVAQAARVSAGEPLQYVLGTVDFMGSELRVDARALIPRPETEQLVQLVLEKESFWKSSCELCCVDVGTGSGCIVLALAQRHPEATWFAVDASPEAIELAQENAGLLGLESDVSWICGDLLGSFSSESMDLIVANLPYIPTAVCAELDREVREFEPESALDGGSDGLTFVRSLAAQAENVLREGGYVFLEIGQEQGDGVVDILQKAGFSDVLLRKDLAGYDRFVSAGK